MNTEATVDIIKGPHELFTGANGHKTYGITVRARNEEEVKSRGRLAVYNINDYMIANYDLYLLGLTPDEEAALKEEMALMAAAQE